jgi:hypothetical protein
VKRYIRTGGISYREPDSEWTEDWIAMIRILNDADSPKAPVHLALPSKVLDSYFPQLFPLDQSGG